MEFMLIALTAWVFIGFAVAWLLGRASDLDGARKESVTHGAGDSSVTYRFIQLKGLTAQERSLR